jgi:hypothetical protein
MMALRKSKERDVVTDPTQAEIYELQKGWGDSEDLSTFEASIASTSNGQGASLVGVEDAAGLIAATDVEGALAEIATDVAAIGTPVQLKGTWDASSGSFPGSGLAQAGWSYIVSTAGTVDSVVFVAGDRIVAIANNASTSTYAANWHHLDYTDQVSSVDGQTGAVDLSGVYQPLDSDLTAIADLETTTFGQSLLTQADAAAARATLDVDQSGTDNSTDVTLAGSYDYLSLTGQQISLSQIDLSTDVTGALPAASVSIADTGGLITATNVEGALVENRDAIDAIEANIANMLETGDIGSTVQAYNAGLTSWASVVRASGFDAFAESPSSANLASLITDEAGSATALPFQSASTFTPSLTFGGGSTGMTFATQTGQYIRIGDLVIFTLEIRLSAKGSSTGAAIITGLPVASIATYYWSCPIAYYSGMASATGIIGQVNASSTSVQLYIPGAASTAGATHANFSDTSWLYVTGAYKA